MSQMPQGFVPDGFMPDEPPPVREAHPEARIGAPRDDAPVTLGDVQDNPAAAFARIGRKLQRDATDPRLWRDLAIGYFGGKALPYVMPAIGAAVRATGRGVASVAPAVVQPAATAAGGYIGGTPGAVAGSAIGERLATAMRARPAPPAAAEAGAVSVAGYPRGSTPSAAPVRSAPVSGQPVVVPPAGPGPNAITPTPAQLGTPVGRVTPVAAPVRDVNAVPAAPVRTPVEAPVRAGPFNPATARADVTATFTALEETPLRAEVSNAMEYIRRGESAEEAVGHVLRLRSTSGGVAPVRAPAPAPVAVAAGKPAYTAEEVAFGQRLMAGGKTEAQAIDAILAQRALLQVPGTQSNAAVRAAQDLRNARGQTKTPSAPTAATRRR